MKDQVHRLHATLWRMREVDEASWTAISDRLGVPLSRLAAVRRAAVGMGLAVKEPNGRVRWLPPR